MMEAEPRAYWYDGLDDYGDVWAGRPGSYNPADWVRLYPHDEEYPTAIAWLKARGKLPEDFPPPTLP